MNTNRKHPHPARRTLTAVEQRIANLADRWNAWGVAADATDPDLAPSAAPVDVNAPIPYRLTLAGFLSTFTDEQGDTYTTNSEY